MHVAADMTWKRYWIVVALYAVLLVLSVLGLFVPKFGNIVQVNQINDLLSDLAKVFSGALVGTISVAFSLISFPNKE